MYFGCHLSAGKGSTAMVNTALSIGAIPLPSLPATPGAARQNRKILWMQQKLCIFWRNTTLENWLPMAHIP